MADPLSAEALFTPCDPGTLGFTTTAELPEVDRLVGQPRALEAVRFGTGIARKGFNLYVLGPSGSGKHALVRAFIEDKARTETVPADYCYVYNFESPHQPRALCFPAGSGAMFRRDMSRFAESLAATMARTLEGDDYRARRQEIQAQFRQRQDTAFDELYRQAEERSVRLLRTPEGFAFAPLRDGQVVDPEGFERLPEHERAQIEASIGELRAALERVLEQMPRWRREVQEQIRVLDRGTVESVAGHLLAEPRSRYQALPDVLSHLDAVLADAVDHAEQFGGSEQSVSVLSGLLTGERGRLASVLSRYQVNLIVDHREQLGAPVVVVDNPTHPNLVGRAEHQAELGTLVTDFSLIKPGALHHANGGYLILDARKLLMQPYAYEGLKRALRTERIHVESLAQIYSLVSTTTLEPEPVPLDVKVVLVGERQIYYLLCEHDEEFNDLFKVAVDLDDEVDRTVADARTYAAQLGTLIRREGLRHFESSAVARVIEHASRVIDDSKKLSTRFGKIGDVLREADYLAAREGRDLVTGGDVQSAIDARDRRHGRIREKLVESMLRGTLVLETTGSAVGRVNGLSVAVLGEYAFGHPVRITARVRAGRGEVVDIVREVELGGPIHSKGVLTLAGYLAGRYCPDRPSSLQASLVFEQVYGPVEGDSASAAELFALLSALADVPLRQSLAVTGSVNQLGEVQAVGAVNDKIEGFFELCDRRGLTGDQGVIIPRANIKNLMLRADVVDAVAAGRFQVHAVNTADEGMALMTGLPVGERGPDGSFPDGSVNQRIEVNLTAMAESVRELGRFDGE